MITARSLGGALVLTPARLAESNCGNCEKTGVGMRLLVAEGHGVVRAGIQRALKGTGAQSMRQVERLQADITLFVACES